MNTESWQHGEFNLALPDKAVKRYGHIYKGLGIHRWDDVYIVTHLNSGHRVGIIAGDLERAKEIAGKIADSADWITVNFNRESVTMLWAKCKHLWIEYEGILYRPGAENGFSLERAAEVKKLMVN